MMRLQHFLALACAASSFLWGGIAAGQSAELPRDLFSDGLLAFSSLPFHETYKVSARFDGDQQCRVETRSIENRVRYILSQNGLATERPADLPATIRNPDLIIYIQAFRDGNFCTGVVRFVVTYNHWITFTDANADFSDMIEILINAPVQSFSLSAMFSVPNVQRASMDNAQNMTEALVVQVIEDNRGDVAQEYRRFRQSSGD